MFPAHACLGRRPPANHGLTFSLTGGGEANYGGGQRWMCKCLLARGGDRVKRPPGGRSFFRSVPIFFPMRGCAVYRVIHLTKSAWHGVRAMSLRVQLLAAAGVSILGVSTATALTPAASATYQTYSCGSCASVGGSPDWVKNAGGTNYDRAGDTCAFVYTPGGGTGACSGPGGYTALECLPAQEANSYGETETSRQDLAHLSGHEDNYTGCS